MTWARRHMRHQGVKNIKEVLTLKVIHFHDPALGMFLGASASLNFVC